MCVYVLKQNCCNSVGIFCTTSAECKNSNISFSFILRSLFYCMLTKWITIIQYFEVFFLIFLLHFFYLLVPFKYVEGNTISVSVNRFCARTVQSAEEHCKDKALTSCDVCNSDECNSAAKYGPAALIVTIAMAVARIFSF